MPPVGLLAIIALGMILAYVLPQRMRERADYAMVRTDDRYSADMRVIRSHAARVDRPAPHRARPAEDDPLLATGASRARLSQVAAERMQRPVAPLDRAATVAGRQAETMRRDRAKVVAARAARARRRGTVAVLATLASAAAWTGYALAPLPMWAAVIPTTILGATVVAGRRAVAAERAVDASLLPVAREVTDAATAAEALRRIEQSRAAGRPVAPSLLETQAIRTLTADDLAPAAPPRAVPAPELPQHEEAEPGWSPQSVPAPSYTLKPASRMRTARPIDSDDLADGQRNAERRAGRPAAPQAPAAGPATRQLDAILARRRASA